MICAPTRIVSIDRCGRAAWPPRPSMSIVTMSADAIVGPGRMPNWPTGMPGRIVHAVDFLDAEALHQAVLDHRRAAGAALLRRLKHDHRGAGEVARLGKIFGGAEQHRGVAVMAAGVHLAGHGGLVRQPGRLLDRQRVHVGAHADHLAARLVAADDADDAGAADARHDLVAAERLELLGDARRRAVDVVLQLRMGMDVVAPFGDFAVQVGDTVDDGHGGSLEVSTRIQRRGAGSCRIAFSSRSRPARLLTR